MRITESLSPLTKLTPAACVLFVQYHTEDRWLGTYEEKSKTWAVANPGKRKVHSLTEAQLNTLFHSFVELRS